MIHFSVDDTIDLFKNITMEDYNSIFEEPTLKFFKKLNEQYGLKASLYCFYEDDYGFNLAKCTDKFKKEFKENSSWLKFGFHAFNRKSNYAEYDENAFINEADTVYNQLKRIMSADNLVYDVRLGFAKGSKECIKKFKNRYPDFNVLYGVEDNRIEYYLTEDENNILITTGVYCDEECGIEIKLSELRLEKQTDFEEYLKNIKKREYNIFFTHEVHLSKEEVREKLLILCDFDNTFTV